MNADTLPQSCRCMFICVCLCLSIYLPIDLLFCLYIHLPIHPCIYLIVLSISVSIYASVHLSTYLSIYLPISLSDLSTNLMCPPASIHSSRFLCFLFKLLSTYPPADLSIYLPTSLSCDTVISTDSDNSSTHRSEPIVRQGQRS